MKSILCALLLTTAGLFAIASPQTPREPLSKAELLELVSRSVPNTVVAEAVRRYGIAFKPTEEVLNEFRKAGANDVVITAMRDSWRSESTNPLSDKDILVLLAEDVRSEKIVNMVQQRGIEFQPTDEYLRGLRSSGANDELIDALRISASKPSSWDQLLQLSASREDTGQIEKRLQERGIDFDPTEDDLGKLRAAGAQESLLQAIRDAKRLKPVKQVPGALELTSSSPTGTSAVRELNGARVVCPPSVSSIPVFASPNDMHTIVVNLQCGDRITILEKDSGRAAFDKILVAGGTEGFVQDLYLGRSMAPANSKITAPVATYQPEPTYTSQARHDQIEGDVDLSIVIDSQGNVAEAQEVSKPLGDGLDKKALETVKTWKFQPAKYEGVPVPVRVTVVVTFRLYR